MDNREMLAITEDKKKIEKIKKRYKNLSMSDETASKIGKLEIANKVLSAAMAISGVVTVIDYIVPDPVIGLDEAALTAITGALTFAKNRVDNHIDELAKSGDTRLQADEVNKLSSKIIDVVNSIKTKGDEPRTM